MDIHRVIGKLPRPKRGFIVPYQKYTGPYNPLHEQLDEYDQPVAGQEPYHAVDAISMRHDICYRDNETKEGKHACDDEMLKELDVLEPKGIRERIDRKLVRSIICTKRKLCVGESLSGVMNSPMNYTNRCGRSSKREECWYQLQMQYGQLIWSTCKASRKAIRGSSIF